MEERPNMCFPSPTTELPPAQLAEQERCIELANEFLRTIGAPQAEPEAPAPAEADQALTPESRRIQLHFRALRGVLVRVTVQSNGKQAEIVGVLAEAGRDFLLIQNFERRYLVPFERVVAVARLQECGIGEGAELEGLDPCLRQDLVLNFGQVVATNPYLINVFYGLSLVRELAGMIGTEVLIKTQDPGLRGKLKGTLVCVTDQTVEIAVKRRNKQRVIKLEEIGMVSV